MPSSGRVSIDVAGGAEQRFEFALGSLRHDEHVDRAFDLVNQRVDVVEREYRAVDGVAAGADAVGVANRAHDAQAVELFGAAGDVAGDEQFLELLGDGAHLERDLDGGLVHLIAAGDLGKLVEVGVADDALEGDGDLAECGRGFGDDVAGVVDGGGRRREFAGILVACLRMGLNGRKRSTWL